MNTNLKGKTALVTGGSKGIGLSIAQALVGGGANIVITARHKDEVEQAARRLGESGPGRAVGVNADVRDYSQVEAAVSRAVREFGGLDALIANAGVGKFAPVQELSVEDWSSMIDTNLTGVFHSVRASVAELAKRKGYVITISSLAGKHAMAGGSGYNATKFGLNGFSEAIMLDLRPLGIKVSYIMPGSVATHFNDHQPSDEDAWKIQPEDIAQIVLDLLAMPERTLPSRVEVRPSQPKPRR